MSVPSSALTEIPDPALRLAEAVVIWMVPVKTRLVPDPEKLMLRKVKVGAVRLRTPPKS